MVNTRVFLFLFSSPFSGGLPRVSTRVFFFGKWVWSEGKKKGRHGRIVSDRHGHPLVFWKCVRDFWEHHEKHGKQNKFLKGSWGSVHSPPQLSYYNNDCYQLLPMYLKLHQNIRNYLGFPYIMNLQNEKQDNKTLGNPRQFYKTIIINSIVSFWEWY